MWWLRGGNKERKGSSTVGERARRALAGVKVKAGRGMA